MRQQAFNVPKGGWAADPLGSQYKSVEGGSQGGARKQTWLLDFTLVDVRASSWPLDDQVFDD